MVFKGSRLRRFVSIAVLAGALGGLVPMIAHANGLPGLTIFGGPGQDNELRYRLDRGGRVNANDRYHLYVPSRKLELGVIQFQLTYPDSFTGRFDIDDIEVRVNNDEVALAANPNLELDDDGYMIDESGNPVPGVRWSENGGIRWDEESRSIDIYLAEPIPARTDDVSIVMEVRNPRQPGMHFFNATVAAPGDRAPINSLGTWVIVINRS